MKPLIIYVERCEIAAVVNSGTQNICGNINADTISGGNVAQVQNLTQPDHTADFLAEIKAQRELYAAHTEKYMQQLANLTQALTALANYK